MWGARTSVVVDQTWSPTAKREYTTANLPCTVCINCEFTFVLLLFYRIASETTPPRTMARPSSPVSIVPVNEAQAGWSRRTVQQTALSHVRLYCHQMHAPRGNFLPHDAHICASCPASVCGRRGCARYSRSSTLLMSARGSPRMHARPLPTSSEAAILARAATHHDRCRSTAIHSAAVIHFADRELTHLDHVPLRRVDQRTRKAP